MTQSTAKNDASEAQWSQDAIRPQFHFSVPSNWANDPNGLVYANGEYHFFYQYHPGSNVWGPMHWGHAVSPDLLNWQHLPVALHPDEKGVIFSGSAVVDRDDTAGFGRNALVAIFTYKHDAGESQALAYSTDQGRTWTKYSGNPVLPLLPTVKDIRDPKVIWYAEHGAGHWVMSLAAGDAVRFYTSPNLKEWTASGSFGSGHGSTAGVWETPDLFELSVDDGPETRWVLTVGVGDGGPAGGSATQYFTGQFDGQTFTSEHPPQTVLWADHGADYYAPQSWNDEPAGRRLMLAWMSNWQYAALVPSTTWRGMFSMPRELSLARTPSGIRLVQRPFNELKALRGELFHWQDETLAPGNSLLSHLEGDCFEILAEFELDPRSGRFGFRVRVGEDEATVIAYDPGQQNLYVDRTQSGQSGFYAGFARLHAAGLAPVGGIIRLHIILDRSSVEVFGNDGLAVITDTIFPSPHSRGLEIFAESGTVRIKTLAVYRLKPSRFILSEQ